MMAGSGSPGTPRGPSFCRWTSSSVSKSSSRIFGMTLASRLRVGAQSGCSRAAWQAAGSAWGGCRIRDKAGIGTRRQRGCGAWRRRARQVRRQPSGAGRRRGRGTDSARRSGAANGAGRPHRAACRTARGAAGASAGLRLRNAGRCRDDRCGQNGKSANMCHVIVLLAGWFRDVPSPTREAAMGSPISGSRFSARIFTRRRRSNKRADGALTHGRSTMSRS